MILIQMGYILQFLLLIFCLIVKSEATCFVYHHDTCDVECGCYKDDNNVTKCSMCLEPCLKQRPVSCTHGTCTPQGCVCSGCWHGDDCDVYQNLYTPVFSDTLYTQQVLPYTRSAFRGIAAFDLDRAECTYAKQPICPCSKVIYGILKGDDSERFQINHDTGELAFSGDDIGHETELKVTIIARNYDGSGRLITASRQTGYATVRISVRKTIDKDINNMLREIRPFPNTYNWRVEEMEPETERDGDVQQTDNNQRDEESLSLVPLIEEEKHFRFKRAVVINQVNTNLTLTGGSAIVDKGDTLTFGIVVSIPVGTSQLTIRVNSTMTASRAVINILNIAVLSIGANLNATGGATNITKVSSFANAEYDSATINFGVVRNIGTDMSTSAPSEISINFTATVLANTQIVNGSIYDVKAFAEHVNGTTSDIVSLTAFLKSTTSSTVTVPITSTVTTMPTTAATTATSTVPTTTTVGTTQTTASTFTVTSTKVVAEFVGNITTVSPTQKLNLGLTITMPIGASNVTLQITSGNKTVPIYHICSIDENFKYGTNLATTQSAYILKTSTLSNFKVDTVRIYLGRITNSGANILSFPPSQITINFTVLVLNTAYLVDNDFCNITASVYQNGTSTSNYTVSPRAKLNNLNNGSAPVITINGPSTLAAGQSAKWTINAVMVRGSNNMSMDIYGSGATPISVCSSSFKSKGSNFECYDEQSIITSTSTKGPTGFVYTFGELLNTDYLYKLATSAANNTVSVEIQGRMPTTATSGSVYKFTVDLSINGTLTTLVFNVTYAAPTWTTTVVPSVAVSKASADKTQITKGSSVLVWVDINIEPNTVDSYSLQMSTTSGLSTICDLRIVSKGNNIPCLDVTNGNSSIVYASTDGNATYSSASVVIGVVTNFANSSDITNVENKITFGVVVQVPQNSTAAASNVISIKADVTSTNKGLTSKTLSLTVTNAIIASEVNTNLTLTSIPPTALPVTARIADIVTWKVQIQFPVTSDKFQLTVQTPVSAGEAQLTVISAAYTYVGVDLGCSYNLKILSTNISSSVPNRQMTTLVADLGFISYLSLGNSANGSVIEIKFAFKVTDHPANTAGSVKTVTYSLVSSGGTSRSVTGNITIALNATDTATLLVNTWTDDTLSIQKIAGDMVTIYGNATLQNTSTAHATNVTFTYMLPDYITYSSQLVYTQVQPTVTQTTKGLSLVFPLITFEDFVTFSFSVTLDPSGYFDPGSNDVYTVLPVDVTYFSLQRTGRTDTAGHYFKQPFILEYMFDVPSAILNISSLTRSCQWVSSSQATNNAAYTAVLPSVAGWRPSYRGQPFCGQEYLQLSLGNKFKVEKIIVYSHGGANLDYITQFIVQTSDNGLAWDTVLENGTSQVKLFNVTFNNAVKQLSDGYQFVLSPKEIFTTRNVRVIPKTASVKNCKPGLRVEFLGYKKTSDVSDNCTTAVNTSSLAVYPRTLLVDQVKGIIFACIETEIRGEVVCSKSEDLGVSWQEMDNSVANVVGVVANSSTVLGISQDGGTYMCSYNGGFDWDSCTIDESNEIKSDPKYTSYKVIPFDDLSALSLAAWKTTYGFTFGTKAITGSVAGLIVDDGTVKTIAWWGTTDWALEI